MLLVTGVLFAHLASRLRVIIAVLLSEGMSSFALQTLLCVIAGDLLAVVFFVQSETGPECCHFIAILSSSFF